MATYAIQLTTDPLPRPFYEVSAAEYERLQDLGLVVGGVQTPVDETLFDQELAQRIEDVNSLTRTALDGRYVVSESINQSARIEAIQPVTQAQYTALTNVDPATMYVIVPG